MPRFSILDTHHRWIRPLTLSFLAMCIAAALVAAVAVDVSASGGVYDRGPSRHARGHVYHSTYHVMRGDTIFSIANRFGVNQYTLASTNGVHNPKYLQAGSTLTIPGLAPHPTPVTPIPTWTPYPPPTPTPTRTPDYQPYVTITDPTWGARLPATFTVSGRGGRLFEGNVVVQAQDRFGNVLAERATVLQGGSVGTGGEGSYSVQLTVQAGANTPGTIVAFSPGAASARDSVEVTYNGGSTSAYLAIDEPASGASLSTSFIARGRGRGLYGGTVVVQAQDFNGRTLDEVVTTLQGSNVGAGGEGTWSVQLNVNQSVDGRVVVQGNDASVTDSVSVRYNAGGPGPGPSPSPSMKDFGSGECVVRPRINAPAYSHPNGPQRGTFPGGISYDARRGVYAIDVYWYYVDLAQGTDNPWVWVRGNDLDDQSPACTW